MSALFSVLIIIVSILLILIVLVQNSKGGGLASNFASSNQFMGVRKTADFLEKATWTLAGALLFLSILTTVTIKSKAETPQSAIENQVRNTPDQNRVPGFSNTPQNTATPPAKATPSDNKEKK